MYLSSAKTICSPFRPSKTFSMWTRMEKTRELMVSGIHTCHPRSFFLRKVTALSVLCCFTLFVCLTLLASFFLPSHLSLKTCFFLSSFSSLIKNMFNER